jgi:uncharacterized protein YjbJ (UPF0337 family)
LRQFAEDFAVTNAEARRRVFALYRHMHSERHMNWDQIAGNWKQFAGKAKEKWGELTDSDWAQVEGKRDQFIGKIQERYGITREEAEKQVSEFEESSERV